MAPSSSPPSPTPSSPSSSTILSPSSPLTLSSDLSSASPNHLYRLSSQYFLTKHFPEASQAIQPLLGSSDKKWQNKAWGLYLAILDNGLRFSDDEGKKVWGRQKWELERSKVKGSELWDDLLEAFQGVKSSIDPALLLAMYLISKYMANNRILVSLRHGDPKVAQLKVEEWLASVPPPYPMQSSEINDLTNGENNSSDGKDFYGKVLELYCTSLLPRNEEWDFAKEFIQLNEYLSPQRKQVFITWRGN